LVDNSATGNARSSFYASPSPFAAFGAMKAALVCLAASAGVAGATVELTEKTFLSAIEGKNAFVKFLAPW